ncbi:MAG: hypothetical protein ACTHMA_22670 [Thermomicrobiales bacterium]
MVTARPVTPTTTPPATCGRWSRRDLLFAALLALLTALSRLPFRTTMLYAWDSGLFAQALRDYNVVVHHPQPPGYVFYVGTAKLLQALTGLGANDTYVAISIAAASLTAAALYLLGAAMFDRPTGALAALLALTSVSFWLFSELAYPYTVLALGSTLIALLAWRLLQRQLVWPPLAALAFGLIAGFRQDLLLFLGPLFAVCYLLTLDWRTRRGWALLGLGLLAGAVGVATWWIGTDLASEGWGSLWRALTIQSVNVERGTSAFATGDTGLRANATLLRWFSKDALHLAVFPALAYGGFWLTQPRREGRRAPFLLLSMTPAILFYLLVHIGEEGYVFSFLPAVLLAAAAGLTRAASAVAENTPRAWSAPMGRTTALVALAALILPYHAWLFLGSGRLLSAERLACKDAAIARAISDIAAEYPPATTQLVTSAYLQHQRVYLPQYTRVQFLDPDYDATWTPPPGVQQVVVFDLELVQRFDRPHDWRLEPLACGGRYNLASVPASGRRFTWDARQVRLEVGP